MEITIPEITAGLIGLGVVILAIILGVTWYYLRTSSRHISSLSQDTKVFSEVARSLSQDMKVLNQSSVALSQDIKVLNQSSSVLSQDIRSLSRSVDDLSVSQKKMIAGIEKVDQKQDEAAKVTQRVAKHFAE